MRLLFQYSKQRHNGPGYAGDASRVPESDWKNLKKYIIEMPEVRRVDVEDAMRVLKRLVEEDLYVGIGEAFWRLVLEEDPAETKVVKVGSSSMTITVGRTVISPVYKQGVDTVDIHEHTWSPGFGEVEPLPDLLDKTPIPDGTVVQILDSWGDPIDTTEVVLNE